MTLPRPIHRPPSTSGFPRASYRHPCLRVLICLLLLAWSSGAPLAMPEAPAPPRVVVVLLPGLRADDLTFPEAPALQRILREGASGWMVCRAARVTDPRLTRPDGRENTASLLLTLGSGSRAVAGPELANLAAESSQNSEIASPPSSAALQALRRRNAQLDHPVEVGALGSLLHRAHLQTAVLGNADTEVPDRSGVAVAMDAAGRVDFVGERPDRNVSDASAPYGFRADVPAMLHDFDHLDRRCALIVLTFGDLARADRYAPLCLPAAAAAHRTAALRALDILLAALRMHIAETAVSRPTRLILLAPGPADSSTESVDRLAPIVLWGTYLSPGTLTSLSTRRRGLVLNTDFLPTVAHFLRLTPPPGLTGRPMDSVPPPKTAEALRADYEDWMRITRQQSTLGGLPTVQMLLALIGFVCLARRQFLRVARTTAVAIAALPLGMLVLPVATPRGVWEAAALLAIFTLLVVLAGGRTVQSARRTLYALCALLVVAILLDLLTGSRLLQQAWMSYSVVEGARFYGIGNEYMGAVIGAACILASALSLRQRSPVETSEPQTPDEPFPTPFPSVERSTIPPARKRTPQTVWMVVSYSLILVVMAAFGAKVGAIPSAGIAFGVVLLILYRGRLRPRDMALLLAVVGLLLATAGLLDLRHTAAQQTHFARALTGAGGDTLIGIARRKLSLEGYLLLHSPWSATLAVCVLALGWLRRTQPLSLLKDNEQDARITRAVSSGLACGAVASLLGNDSGVTAAALILLYGWAWAAVRAEPSSVGAA